MNKKISRSLALTLQALFHKERSFTIVMVLVIIANIGVALIPPLILKDIINQLSRRTAVSMTFAAYYFIFLMAAGCLESLQSALITIYGQKTTHCLRTILAHKIFLLPAAFFLGKEPGKLTSLFVNDVDTIETLFDEGIISMVADSFKVISIVAIIFSLSPGLGVLLVIVTPLLFFFTRYMQRKMLAAQLANRESVAQVNNHLPETIQNIRTIHLLNKETYMENKYAEFIQANYNSMEKANFYDSIYSPIIILTGTILISIMMVLSASGGFWQQLFGMSIGSAVAVITYVGKVFTPLESLGMEIQNIQTALAGTKRIDAFLAEQNRPIPQAVLTPKTSTQLPAVTFKNVTFAYVPGKNILEDFSLTINQGEKVTFMGRTGAGKTTIFRLILNFFTPTSGEIQVLGVPTAHIPDVEKRHIFGYVEQNCRLIPGTIAEQISLGDTNVSQLSIEKAMALVGLHSYIKSLPAGYATPCEASLFSQGQLQLLSIARAIVTEPPILLLDEITANLDVGTEEAINLALERAVKGRTVISISHRQFSHSSNTRLIKIGK